MSYRDVLFLPIDGLFFCYRSLQKVLIVRFEKRTGPCDWSENVQKLVLRHAYLFPIYLWHFHARVLSLSKTCDDHKEDPGLAENLRVKK